MDNEKLNNEELETAETTEGAAENPAEVAEEVTEEAAEVVEDSTEEAEEVTEEAAEDSEEAAELAVLDGADGSEIEITDEYLEPPKSKGKVCAIICGIAAVVIVAVGILFYTGVINPFEKGYIDISGVTLADLADESGYSIREYKKMNGLPWYMSKSTNENAVKNNIKIKATLAQSGGEFKELKEYYGWDDSITEDTTVGEALGATKLSVILGVSEMDKETANQALDSVKEIYGLGDDVTLDTLYGDVRETIDTKTKENRLKEEQKSDNKDSDKEQKNSDSGDKESKDEKSGNTEDKAE